MAVGSVNLPSELLLNEKKRCRVVFMKLDREHGLLSVSGKEPSPVTKPQIKPAPNSVIRLMAARIPLCHAPFDMFHVPHLSQLGNDWRSICVNVSP